MACVPWEEIAFFAAPGTTNRDGGNAAAPWSAGATIVALALIGLPSGDDTLVAATGADERHEGSLWWPWRAQAEAQLLHEVTHILLGHH